MSWNYFNAEKSQVSHVLAQQFKFYKGHGKTVKNVCLDNAGEHQTKLHNTCAEAGVTLEYTALATSQLNGVVERRFVTNRTRANAMMEATTLQYWVKQIFRAEAVRSATKIGFLTCNTNQITPYELFYGIISKLTPAHMVEFARNWICYLPSENSRKKTNQSPDHVL
jgi:hypothetical protein